MSTNFVNISVGSVSRFVVFNLLYFVSKRTTQRNRLEKKFEIFENLKIVFYEKFQQFAISHNAIHH